MHDVNKYAPLSITLLLFTNDILLTNDVLLTNGVLLEDEYISPAASVLTKSAASLLNALVAIVYLVRLERRPFWPY